jgi:pseudaminic acid biosynthesis-associated methylase
MGYSTEQENFWAGDFGDDYIARNRSDGLLHSKVAMWSQMIRCANRIDSIKELGCNIGLNLKALHHLNPEYKLSGVEINKAAANEAKKLGIASINCGTITEPLTDEKADLTFTAGVLIHINPERLPVVYNNLVSLSSRYILVAEYYNPTPGEVIYRGHTERLFKRDFAGELIDEFRLNLVDYGFWYRGDNIASEFGDMTWFLLEK